MFNRFVDKKGHKCNVNEMLHLRFKYDRDKSYKMFLGVYNEQFIHRIQFINLIQTAYWCLLVMSIHNSLFRG